MDKPTLCSILRKKNNLNANLDEDREFDEKEELQEDEYDYSEMNDNIEEDIYSGKEMLRYPVVSLLRSQYVEELRTNHEQMKNRSNDNMNTISSFQLKQE